MRLARRGFTLVEVMIAFAILGMALVILVKSVASSATAAGDSYYMGIATDLARHKMAELEEKLLDEGFQDAEQEDDGDFGDEGWDGVKWKSKIEPAELPSYEKVAAIANAEPGEGDGSGSGSGSGDENAPNAADKFQSSALGNMLSAFGGGFGGGGGGGQGPDTASEANTGVFIQQYYSLVQQVLKASIRKITLTISYDTGIRKESFDVVLYVTDPAGMAKAMGAVGT